MNTSASLSFDPTLGKGPERLMMYERKGYPAGIKTAKSPFVVGRIAYDDGTVGTLIYIKSTLIEGMEFTTSGYLAANPTFPHQSTIDQFFDPDQFDAYRYLGYDIGRRVIDSLALTRTLPMRTRSGAPTWRCTSRPSNVWDKAAIESFSSTPKTEQTQRKIYKTRNGTRADAFDYIGKFDNATCRHSTIGYLSPVEFERKMRIAEPGVHQPAAALLARTGSTIAPAARPPERWEFKPGSRYHD